MSFLGIGCRWYQTALAFIFPTLYKSYFCDFANFPNAILMCVHVFPFASVPQHKKALHHESHHPRAHYYRVRCHPNQSQGRRFSLFNPSYILVEQGQPAWSDLSCLGDGTLKNGTLVKTIFGGEGRKVTKMGGGVGCHGKQNMKMATLPILTWKQEEKCVTWWTL